MTAHNRPRGKSGKRIIVGDYEVGWGKPPLGGRIKPGERRNPKGRPKKPKVGERTLDHFLSEEVTIEKDGRRQTLTKRELAYAQIANKAAKGDERAVKLMLAYDAARQTGAEQLDPLLFDEALSKKILHDLLETEEHHPRSGEQGISAACDGSRDPS